MVVGIKWDAESAVSLTELGTGEVFSEQELLAFEVSLGVKAPSPTSRPSQQDSVGLCRRNSRRGCSYVWEELYVNLLPRQSVSTLP